MVLEEIRLEGLDYDLRRTMDKIKAMLNKEKENEEAGKAKKYTFTDKFIQTIRREQLPVSERVSVDGLDE
jgi:hypothetical protein